MNEAMLTIPEVAKYLKMSKSKVYALVQQGKIPHIRIGRNVRIRETELNKWLETHKEGEKLGGKLPSFYK